MDYSIAILEEHDIDKFRETYLFALENNWETLEGNKDIENWKWNFKTWINKEFTIFLLKKGENIVGYITGDSSRILHLWVQKKYRSNYFGKELVNKFLTYQGNRGLNKFTLKAYNENIDYFIMLGATIQSNNSKFAILKFDRS